MSKPSASGSAESESAVNQSEAEIQRGERFAFGENWRQFLAVLNEIVRHKFSYGFWLGFKLWGVIPLTVLFAFANIPMLMKYGFSVQDDDVPIPPEG